MHKYVRVSYFEASSKAELDRHKALLESKLELDESLGNFSFLDVAPENDVSHGVQLLMNAPDP